MNDFDFGPLSSFIEDELITDINYNGKQLWIDHLQKGRYCENFEDDEFIQQFCFKMANYVNCSFNVTSPILEAETKDLRISILHESIAKSGHSVSIRKTPAVLRLVDSKMMKEKYASSDVLKLLKRMVENHCNIIVSGLPSSGKTELVKYLTQFIPPNERIITIEDTLELRAHDIYEDKDIVALRVSDRFTYVDAIKASLRQRPDWILVSEVRSHEIVHLLESISTGTHLISTIHAYDATKIPKRILHMFKDVELSNQVILNNIYDSIDFGIHLEATITSTGVKRAIKQIVCFEVKEDQAIATMIYDGKLHLDALPENKLKKLKMEKRK